MVSRRQNCWDYMKCGREPGGPKVVELGICPAASDTSFDGINLGENAGRFCWAVAGTFCSGKVQGSFADKRASCITCDFFQEVQKEEGTAGSHSKFLGFLSRGEESAILRGMTYRHVRAGERFITQGEVAEAAYIIQRGSCLVLVEKEGNLYPVGHRGKGEIVGELTLLTGEPQNAHVEAETDMDVWVLNKTHFGHISRNDPELLDFLTELVADRFDSRRPTADRVIGKYLANEIIGRGGYSIIYKGIHTALNMPVAIKMMRHNLGLCPEFLGNFWNEAKIIARLHHENIIRVYDIEDLYGTVFIIMELVEGESLREMIERLEVIPPSLAADFLVQICAGLGYAHKEGILHQDINPTNLLVQRNDRLKILDFGLACPPGTEDRGIFDGTVEYMAPEQIECEPVDERTDIYALGITGYEMVTGRKPFQTGDIRTVMETHLNLDIPDPAEVVPDLPETLRRFIIKAGRREPAQRYGNMEEAMKDLLPPLSEEFHLGGIYRPVLDPIQVLTNEHALIRQFLDNLAIAVDKLETGETPAVELFEKALRFARNFVDKFHHIKEEHLMFAQLAQKKEGLLDGPIEALRHQHERGRDFITEIYNALGGYARGDELHTTNLLENSAAYIHLLRRHIHREDHNFFPLVRDVFSEKELWALSELFGTEDAKFGDKFFHDSQELVHEMARLL
jgi:serine/threonine protein kinase